MNNITLCIPTLNQYDLLFKCVESSVSGNVKPKKISIVDNGQSLPEYNRTLLDNICKNNDMELSIYVPFHNLGVAKSWNWFIQKERHPMLIANDDLEFSDLDIRNFNNAYYETKASFFYPANISSLNMFSCFMPTLDLILAVGLFDESFYPAYFEDNDYYYRMKLAGIELQEVPTKIIHKGSATINAFDSDRKKLHHENFRKNWIFYQEKWGGTPHNETYTTPFGR